MWPDRVSNPGPLTCESVALPTALRGPAALILIWYPFTAGSKEKVFQSMHGEAKPRTHNLTATYFTIIELL